MDRPVNGHTRSVGTPDMDVTFRFSCHPEAPADARAAVAALPLPARLRADLQLVASELVTNAVKYGPGRTIELRLSMRDGVLCGEVHDEGPPDTVIRARREPTSDGGYGLRIVERVADRWGVRDGSTRVWFELRTRRLAPVATGSPRRSRRARRPPAGDPANGG